MSKPEISPELHRARQLLRHFIYDETAQRLLIAWPDVPDRERAVVALCEDWADTAGVVPALVLYRAPMLFRIRACRQEAPWVDETLLDLVTALILRRA